MNSPYFVKPTKADWKDLAEKDLKTDNLDSLLQWQPFEGINANAYYDQSDRPAEEFMSFFSQLKLKTCDLLEPIIIQKDANASNQQALEALNMGATGLLFKVDQPVNQLESIFKGILINHCAIAFQGSHADEWSQASSEYFHQLPNRGLVINGKKLIPTSTNYKSLGLSVASKFDIVSELNAYLENLEKLHRIYGDQFLNHLNVSVTLDEKFYQSISVCRAVRWLTYLYAVSSQLPFNASQLFIHTEIQTAGNYKKDLLLNTSAGVSAVLGGASSVCFEMNSGKGASFDRRIARNTGNLLRDESHLLTIMDTVSGSYFIDALTNLISEKSWNTYISQS